MALASVVQKTNFLLFQKNALERVLKSSLSTTSVLSKHTKAEEEDSEELGYPLEIDMAQGMYKKELVERAAGNIDPFEIFAIDRADKGSKIDPIRVHSAYESRMIGCRCEPDAHTIVYMWLHQGEPKRCRCGFWMELYYKPPFVEYKLPL